MYQLNFYSMEHVKLDIAMEMNFGIKDMQQNL